MKNKISLFLFITCIYITSIANSSIDSLKLVLENYDNVDSKIQAYLELSKEYQHINLDSAQLFAKHGMNLAMEMKSELQIAKAFECIADINVMQDDLQSASLYYENSLDILRKYDSSTEMAEVLLALGNIELYKGNYSESMNHYLEGSKICEEIKYCLCRVKQISK